MMTDSLVEQSFSAENRKLIQDLKDKAWFDLLKWYVPLFGAFGYIYYFILPKFRYGSHIGVDAMSDADYVHVFEAFAAFFGCIFLFFLVRDFRRMVLPLYKEMRNDKKFCIQFLAKKYKDPFFDKCLLFYPGKENVYIEVCQEDFDATGNDQELYLETASITGEVFLLKRGDSLFKDPSEFRYSDERILTDSPYGSRDTSY